MYSIKPGRGPSLIGAILSLIIGVPFVLFWIGGAHKAGAPGFFVFFGVIMLAAIIITALLGLYNATARDRISEFDVTTRTEENDPFDSLAPPPPPPSAHGPVSARAEQAPSKRFCPYCGESLAQDFRFCPGCGKAQPGSASGNPG